MGRTVTVITGLLFSLAVSACSGDSVAGPSDPTPTPETTSMSSSSTSPPTSAPTSSATQEPPAQPPEMPALAEEKSPAGAKAFVKYYMAVLNYSWHAGSATLARRFSTPDCIACRGIARSIDQMARSGGYYRGGEWAAALPVLIPSEPIDKPVVHTALEQSPGTWKRSEEDRLRRIPSSRQYIDVHLTRVGASWKVTSLVFA